MSRVIGILSFVALLLTGLSTLLGAVAPEYTVYALALAAAISAFTERIQGGSSVDGESDGEQGLISRQPTRKAGKVALALNVAATVATLLGAVKPSWGVPILTGVGVASAVTERVGKGGVSSGVSYD
jgi:hypothetical protein